MMTMMIQVMNEVTNEDNYDVNCGEKFRMMMMMWGKNDVNNDDDDDDSSDEWSDKWWWLWC